MTIKGETLNQMLKTAVASVDMNAVQQRLNEKMQKLALEGIDELFGYNGAVAKPFKEMLQKDLGFAGQMDLSRFREQLLGTIQNRTAQAWNAQVGEAVEKSMAVLLKEPPAQIKLSELVEIGKKITLGSVYSNDDHPTEVKYNLEERDRMTSLEFQVLELDFEYQYSSSTSTYLRTRRNEVNYKFRMHMSRNLPKEGEPENLWKISFMQMPGMELKEGQHARFIGHMDEFEAILFQLHSCETKLELDWDHVNWEYDEPECHC